jgi:hypothetical protein
MRSLSLMSLVLTKDPELIAITANQRIGREGKALL